MTTAFFVQLETAENSSVIIIPECKRSHSGKYSITAKILILPLCPHFPYLLHLENDPQKQQAMYEERTQQNMVIWRARAESALRKTTINNVKLC